MSHVGDPSQDQIDIGYRLRYDLLSSGFIFALNKPNKMTLCIQTYLPFIDERTVVVKFRRRKLSKLSD